MQFQPVPLVERAILHALLPRGEARQ